MIRAALLALFLVAACGKSTQKKSEPEVASSAGSEKVWRQNWDLKRSKRPVPEEDTKRLANDALFRCN